MSKRTSNTFPDGIAVPFGDAMRCGSFVLMLGVSILLVRPLSVFAAATPDFGPNVLIFDPGMPTVQQKLDEVFRQQERNQFGSERYAFLFKPGHYKLDLQAGFYTQVLGLGRSPDDVEITGAVRSTSKWMQGNATCNFWRAVENLAVTPTRDGNTDQWAVSQGTQLRRDHFKGELHLWDWGWSSGGFLADSKIDGRIVSGSQQQWISRNTEWGKWDGGVWNMVFVGAVNPPAGEWPSRPYTNVDKTPLIREKPFLSVDADGRYSVVVPPFSADSSEGLTWSGGATSGTAVPIEQFFIARPGRDNAASINAALAAGKHLLFTPGVYQFDSSIRITRPGTIVLGLGYPTLVPRKSEPTMVLSDVDGIKVGGLIFDAGPVQTPALLQVGEPRSSKSHASDPTFLYDICARAGGATAGTTDCFVTINSNNVVGDNVWLWRADHGDGAGWTSNKVRNGLVVNGNDVTFYGLFVEHCQEYQTLWNANGGRVYFYQCEMPYDPPSQAAWSHDGGRGYAAYKVADTVITHQAWGLGVYSYFTAAPVTADNAIETPTSAGIQMHNMMTIRLGGQAGSGIAHVVNGKGDGLMTVTPVRVSE